MDEQTRKWLKTTAIAVIGGGLAAATTMALDPTRYHFPHDIGSGKLLIQFFSGAGITFLALLLKSPLGQQVMASYKETQIQMKGDQALITESKTELRSASPDGVLQIAQDRIITEPVKPPEKP